MMWPFKWKLSACTYTWCYLFFKISQTEIWKFGRNLLLAKFGGERVKQLNFTFWEKDPLRGNQLKRTRRVENLQICKFETTWKKKNRIFWFKNQCASSGHSNINRRGQREYRYFLRLPKRISAYYLMFKPEFLVFYVKNKYPGLPHKMTIHELVHNVVKAAFKNGKKTRDTNKAREKL